MNSNPKIGIVGPLSNAASWQNTPQLFDENGHFSVNSLPIWFIPDDMADIVRNTSSRLFPHVTFVNGFCFMLKRELLKKVGLMNDKLFPLGYGEENDFCIRAQNRDYLLAIADNSYVFHAKSKSFGHDQRKVLSEQGSMALQKAHGGQKVRRLTTTMRNHRELNEIRRAVTEAIPRWVPESLRKKTTLGIYSLNILFVLPVDGVGGGIHSVVQETYAMRKLGISARVAVREQHRQGYLNQYAELDKVDEIFVGFNSHSISALAKNCNVAIATIYHSVDLVQTMLRANPDLVPCYYIQDYEPLFFKKGTPQWQTAYDSYSKIDNAVLFAKEPRA